jgi:predicted nucleic acid-binding Zn ribbon protein
MMTAEQKAEIIALRSDGTTFSDIAEQLGLSINTVKSFYRRCENAPEKAAASYCKCCGKAIAQPSGAREKKFCSDKCRMEWWNAHRDDVNKKAFYDYVCECCGRHFLAYGNKRRKYCSRECYIADRFKGGDGNE